MDLCTYCLMDTPVKHCKVVSHVAARAPQLCRYCETSVLETECVVQEHWENRLQVLGLPQSTSIDKPGQFQMRIDGVKLERLVPLTGSHEQIADRSKLPTGWHSAESGDVESRAGITTYRDLNIWERCASPRENSAGWQI